jgi:pyruvate/2-oxoglutarate dehydrogenase complex dihydrolipoamide acyltransferase (E2) component
MRIALAATLAFVALWLVALRPKPVEDVAPAPVPAAEPNSTSLTERPAQAAEAVGNANAASAGHEAAANGAPASAAPATQAPAPAAAADKAPAAKPAKTSSARTDRGADAVLRDLDAGRTVVLLFWDRRAPDDRSARHAVARVDRRGGKVGVHVAPIRDLGRYGRITQSVPVTQSPTVLVIGRDKKAETITGLTVAEEIDDKVRTVLRRTR